MVPNPKDPYYEKEALEKKFLSFDHNIDAKSYQIHIEKYGELDMYEMETKTRAIISEMIDPIHKSQNLGIEE